ncbi:MAG: ATP-dependent helicase [Chitinivibrionales bacterium]
MTKLGSNQPILDRIILNKVQKDAVVCEEWPQLVFAGAGSGKTRVLTAKIAYLIEEKEIFPSQIFAATFTNKAATEMRGRIEELLNMPCKGLWIGTFHSLCVRILRREASRLGYTSSFSIYDTADQLSVIKSIMKELQIDERTIPPRRLLHTISSYKNDCMPPDQVAQLTENFYQEELAKVYEQYQKMLKKQQAMDFDDLITNTVYLLQGNKDLLSQYQRTFQYILVDEYQDTNASQFKLVQMLGMGHQRIFAVGDDDQSIYGWRGARIENILTFENLFPGTSVFKLEENYRSTPAVLDFANAIIRANQGRADKRLWTGKKAGDPVTMVHYRDDRQESQGVADKIEKLIRQGTRGGDIAILFRTNAQSRPFEDVLRRRNIPYVLVGGTSFYERKEIKDCVAFLRLLVNPKDDVSCERIINVPSRGIGAKSLDTMLTNATKSRMSLLETVLAGDLEGVSGKAAKGLDELKTVYSLLIDLAKAGESPPELLRQVLTLTGYIDALESEDSEEAQSRLENINEFTNAVAIWSEENPDSSLDRFLEEISLASDVDQWQGAHDSVNLMTLHSAKGLEFENVFLVGLEDGILPSRQNFDDRSKLEEECRLLYVGITRAQALLYCSFADQRWRFGSTVPSQISRFLTIVPEDLFKMEDFSRMFEYQKPSSQMRTPVRTARPAASFPSKQAPKKPDRAQKITRTKPVPEPEIFSQEEVQFRMGQVVSHKNYGQGKIISISGFGPDMRLTILFNDGSRRKLMARFANLEV